MDALSLFCPQCGTTFAVNENDASSVICCPGCSTELSVKPDGVGGFIADYFSGKANRRPESILVSSGSLSQSHEILGMVCITIGTRGEMASQFQHLKEVLADRIGAYKKGISMASNLGQTLGGIGLGSSGNIEISSQYAGASFASNDPEIAFHIAVNQIQLRASYLGSDAVIGFRYNIDLDSNHGVLNFIAHAYGTAVRFC